MAILRLTTMHEHLNSVIPFSHGSPLATKKRMQHSQSTRSLAIRYLHCCTYQDRSAFRISRYNFPTSLKITLQTLKGKENKSGHVSYAVALDSVNSKLFETSGKAGVVCNCYFKNCNVLHNSHDLIPQFLLWKASSWKLSIH